VWGAQRPAAAPRAAVTVGLAPATGAHTAHAVHTIVIAIVITTPTGWMRAEVSGMSW
jgi:hypothetical protein